MKAIVTKYVPATETKPSKIVAKAGKTKQVFSYESLTNKLFSLNNSMHLDFVHREAAFQFRDQMGWEGTLVSGDLPNGDVAHIFYK